MNITPEQIEAIKAAVDAVAEASQGVLNADIEYDLAEEDFNVAQGRLDIAATESNSAINRLVDAKNALQEAIAFLE